MKIHNQRIKKPTIAIIGGGIFGVTAALVLGDDYHIEIFERQSDILQMASRTNQYRHHMGYHYPRSFETIQEIKDATQDFEAVYGNAVLDFPAYYAVSKQNSLVSAKDFLRVCDALNLPYEKEYPDESLLDRGTVTVCIKTPEKIFHYGKLAAIVKKNISLCSSIILNFKSYVISAEIDQDGAKILSVCVGGETIKKRFDYVINATYAQYNVFCDWLGFPKKDLELRLKELVVVKMKASEIAAVTIMDGPFATIVPTGQPDVYTVGDVALSIHEVYNAASLANTARMIDQKLLSLKSRWAEIQKHSSTWFPVLKTAEYLYSMFVALPVEIASKKTDARPTDVVYHGNGCWSILSGKVITCVSAAKKIKKELFLLRKT